MVSGSFSGGLSFFKGMPGGKFAAEQKMLRNGKPLHDESAQSPCLGDWDGDGDFDLTLGLISGQVMLYTNEGGMRFSDGKGLTAEGKPILADDGGPCIVDWDGDGTLDLLLGDAAGNVWFHRGLKKGGTDLAKGVALIPEAAKESGWTPAKRDPKAKTGLDRKRPGVRVKPWAGDWNGDGKLDLLVGDFLQLQRAEKVLTPDQRLERDELVKRQQEAVKKMEAVNKRIFDQAAMESGVKSTEQMTPEQRTKFSEAYMRIVEKDEEYQKVSAEYQEVEAKLQPLQNAPEATGFVWVYLRK